jgi:hypothetical protein
MVTRHDTSTRDTSSHERRRDRRQGAGWLGSYRLPEQPRAGWAQCRILDISGSGIGLELFGPPWPPDGRGVDLVIRFDAGVPAGSRTAQLPGVIRNHAASKFGFVRVGVEFVGLNPEERELLDALVERQPV